MAKKEKKVLGLFSKSLASVLVVGVAVAVVLAFLWSYLMDKTADDMNPYNRAWAIIAESLVLALIIGLVVGILGGSTKASYLWIAAGLGVVAVELAKGLQGAMVPWDGSLAGALGASGLTTVGVTSGQIIVAIVAAASVGLGTKIKL